MRSDMVHLSRAWCLSQNARLAVIPDGVTVDDREFRETR
ncbi:protein of unknown function [Methylorubrum extorquens]|uniref:Uncharacterized protein n=1 Tax=Methylorubrum extorquens TaxID=408 RepID=A0A2N9AJ68_METEX|nr:protein of unknown function [Methylorubrum extorquens]